MPRKYVELDFDELKHETEKAYLFVIDEEEVWIPKSVCEEVDEELNIVEIQEWFAEQEGLI